MSYLDFLSPFSQSRYYYSVSVFSLFWFIALGGDSIRIEREKLLAGIFTACAAFVVVLLEHEGTVTWNAPHLFAGIRSIQQAPRSPQPLTAAIDRIRKDSGIADSILIDYVPQYVNWYFRGHPVALIPDPSARTVLNSKNPLFATPLQFPDWHLWYPGQLGGYWSCTGHCDFSAGIIDWTTRSYPLTSKTLNRTVQMCIVQTWPSSPWEGAPFRLINALDVTYKRSGMLALARRCQ